MRQAEVLLQTYYILLPVISTALIGWVGMMLKEQREKEKHRENKIKEDEAEAKKIRKANSTGIMLVLRYMLKRYHSEYMIQEKMSYAQYQDWLDLYHAYKALGGNSIADEWNEDVERLKKSDSASNISPFEVMLQKYNDDITPDDKH